ncbi:MAG: phosphatase, partial [Roseburia sp.]|nr:phosphatase [Roseburia sp.]
MSVHTFAAIYIGSYEVSLKVFEFSSKKKIKEIDHVRSRLELGKDAYSKGSIGYELVEALCERLGEFSDIMKSYRVDSYEAYAAAALRDVSNQIFILDQIKIRTGLHVHVLSNSEHRFISYKSVAMRDDFEKMVQQGSAVVDVGGGGLQITIFS